MAYPYMNYPNMFNQPMNWNQYQQSSTQQTSFAQTNNPFTMVSGVADVEKVIVQPSESKWILVQNEPVLAVKTANAIGYVSSEYYWLNKFDPSATQAEPVASYLTAEQADEKIRLAVKAEVERAMSQYQTGAKATRTKGETA